MEAVFLNILELSLRGSLLILAILPLRALLKKAPRWSICLLWVLAAIALVCPIRFESTASVIPSDSVISEIIAPAPALPLVQTEPILIQDLPVENGVHIITHTEPDYAAIATIFWLIGVAVMLCVAAVSYVRLKNQVAASLLVKDNVYLCDDIGSPFILGILRPRIYLPSALDTALYHSVLLHEYAHLKRRDHWWKPLGYLLLTVHWFNPLVWVGYTLLCRDIELACDEKVIRDMDTQRKIDYSEALLQCSMPRHLITACPLAFGEVGAKQRIKAVLHYKKPAFWVIVITLVLCAALALGFLTDPKVTSLGELGDMTKQDMKYIQAHDGTYVDSSSIRSATDTEAVCEALAQIELKHRISPLFEYYDDWNAITLYPENSDNYYRLIVAPDYSALKLIHFEYVNDVQNPKKSKYYEILNPDFAENILHSEEFFTTDRTTLWDLIDLSTEAIHQIAVYPDNATARSVQNMDAALKQLNQLELLERMDTLRIGTDWPRIELRNDNAEFACTLYFTPTLGELVVQNADANNKARGLVYQVLNPNLVESLLRSEVFYVANTPNVPPQTVTLPDDSTKVEFTFSPMELESVIEGYLNNKNKNIANLTLIGNVFTDTDTYYAVVSMDYTARDGSVISKNNLYLAQLRWMDGYHGEFRVEGLASGEWGASAGYYPNVADFGGQTVVWTTRNDTRANVFDGGVGSDGTVPNKYDTYRITCKNGETHIWKAQNATGVFVLPKGQIPVKVAPVDENYRDISALSFDLTKVKPVEVRTISEVSGWDVFLEMDANGGEILELHGEPIADPIFPNGFNEHKALYQALLAHPELTHWDRDTLELLGQQSYGDYEYAVIAHDNNEAVLVEYTLSGSTATLLNYAVGYPPDTQGFRTGYYMNCSSMEGGILYWSLYAPRYKVTPNGKDVDDSHETVTPDFSGFRFTMRDLKTHDFPADDSFFLCEFTGVIPPAIVTPMEKGKLLAALGSEVGGGLTGTLSLKD